MLRMKSAYSSHFHSLQPTKTLQSLSISLKWIRTSRLTTQTTSISGFLKVLLAFGAHIGTATGFLIRFLSYHVATDAIIAENQISSTVGEVFDSVALGYRAADVGSVGPNDLKKRPFTSHNQGPIGPPGTSGAYLSVVPAHGAAPVRTEIVIFLLRCPIFGCSFQSGLLNCAGNRVDVLAQVRESGHVLTRSEARMVELAAGNAVLSELCKLIVPFLKETSGCKSALDAMPRNLPVSAWR